MRPTPSDVPHGEERVACRLEPRKLTYCACSRGTRTVDGRSRDNPAAVSRSVPDIVTLQEDARRYGVAPDCRGGLAHLIDSFPTRPWPAVDRDAVASSAAGSSAGCIRSRCAVAGTCCRPPSRRRMALSACGRRTSSGLSNGWMKVKMLEAVSASSPTVRICPQSVRRLTCRSRNGGVVS